jgi:hypothetical protein
MIDILNELRKRTGREPIVPKQMTSEEAIEHRANQEKIAIKLGFPGIWRKENQND